MPRMHRFARQPGAHRLVAGLESTHSRSDPDHDPGHVMAQNEREAVRQNALELAVSDFGIQKVDTSGVDLDQYVILPQLRVWRVAGPDMVDASVTLEDECLHCSLRVLGAVRKQVLDVGV